jgi:hypothetical protein
MYFLSWLLVVAVTNPVAPLFCGALLIEHQQTGTQGVESSVKQVCLPILKNSINPLQTWMFVLSTPLFTILNFGEQ